MPGSVKVVLNAMEEVESEDWSKFTNAFLIVQSGKDKLIDPFAAVDFEKKSGSKDKTVIYCKDMWHSVFG